MNRYSTDHNSSHASPPSSADGTHVSLSTDRHDDHGSPSSEDGLSRAELDTEGPYILPRQREACRIVTPTEDVNTALTSQTLNADGTPKRPMNAFMIYARRRRPQVSSENSTLRTGDISKILSKEWNAMQQSEKQFYLDQAKTLKETFNSKYPDYIYKRRPNNSRRKRRPDPSAPRLPDQGSENGDELSPLGGDAGSNGLGNGDDGRLGFPSEYSRSHTDVSQGYGDSTRYSHSQSRTPNYTYPNTDTYRQSGASHHDPRLPPYSASPERYTHDVSSLSRLSQQGSGAVSYQYAGSQGHALQTGYSAEVSDSQWERSESSRSSGWIPNQDRSLAPLSASRSSSYSPTTSHWSNTSGAGPSGPQTHTTGGSSSYFPTLNSPYYPTPAQLSTNYPPPPSSASTTSQSSSPAPYASTATHLPPLPMSSGRDYDDSRATYATSPTIGSTFASGRDAGVYTRSLPRGLPPLQSTLPTSYSQSQPPLHVPSPNVRQTSAYWPSDKVDGM